MSAPGDTAEYLGTLTEQTFQGDVLDAPGSSVVEFMSYGCGHCRAMEPVIQDVAAQLAASVRFFRVNVASEPALADRFAIEATPTLVMFAGGREVDRAEGPHPEASSLRRVITRAFDR